MNKVLVIEDDIYVRDSVSLSLESAGYVVMGAANCQEGLQNHRQFGASVIIADVVSLENEGRELLQQLCQQPADIPLITLRGTLSHSDAPSLRPWPIMPKSFHSLQKPFTLDELLATVQHALAR